MAHVCNDIGRWGKGFVLAISQRWPTPEAAYRAWNGAPRAARWPLGAVQLMPVAETLWVANMIGQHGIRPAADGTPPVRYEAIDIALAALHDQALLLRASVHMPRIGAALPGGAWDRIEPLIRANLAYRGVPVTVYDLVSGR
ncbi:Appr-1-p processing protein [Streptomyces boninensis]|uniref:Appr-1-p processing protein n=1 Tax=Streptomyces boninensis TaxID=2039455 RepID=UPI003B227003